MENFSDKIRSFIPFLLMGACAFLIGYSVCLMVFGDKENPVVIEREPNVRDLLDSLETLPSATYNQE